MNGAFKRIGWGLHAAGVAIVGASIGLAWSIVYRPLEQARGEALARCEEIGALLESADRLRAEQAELKRSLAAERDAEAALMARVPHEPREAEFLGQISRLAKEVGLELRDYRPGLVHPQPTYSTMEIALTCEGGYEPLCRFLDGLGRLPRLVNMTHLNVDGSRGAGVYLALLKLAIYFQASEQVVTGAGSDAHG